MSIRNYSTTAASNNLAPPNGWPEGMAPSGVNNAARQMMADIRETVEALPFFDYGNTPTRIDADTFTVSGDLTSRYAAGYAVKLVGATTETAIISSSTYSAPDTTVNVLGTVPNSLTNVAVTLDGSTSYSKSVTVGVRASTGYEDVDQYPITIFKNQNSRAEIILLNTNTGSSSRGGIVVGVQGEGAVALRGFSNAYAGFPGGPSGGQGVLHTGGVFPLIFGTNDITRMFMAGDGSSITHYTPLMLTESTGPIVNRIKTSGNTSADIVEYTAVNHANQTFYSGISNAAYGGAWTGSPTGAQIYFGTTASIPITIGTNSVQRIGVSGAGVVSFSNTAANSFLVGSGTTVLAGCLAQFLAPASAAAVVLKNVTAANMNAVIWNADTAGDNGFIEFDTEAGGTPRGSITYNRGGGVVAFNTTSDRRLKTNIQDADSASSIIDLLRVRSFDWIESGAHVGHWFVAQELYEVAPIAVTKGDDGEEVTKQWSVDPSKLVPLLVKEIQELRVRMAAMEARLA